MIRRILAGLVILSVYPDSSQVFSKLEISSSKREQGGHWI
jgi:hypothetical protein